MDQLIKTEFPEGFFACGNWEAHKQFHMTPEFLRSKGIPVVRTVQEVNDMIINFLGGYHAGFSEGTCLNEAINFGKHVKCYNATF